VISITKKKLIIVSNREPYVHRISKEEIVCKKSLGGGYLCSWMACAWGKNRFKKHDRVKI